MRDISMLNPRLQFCYVWMRIMRHLTHRIDISMVDFVAIVQLRNRLNIKRN